MELESDRLLTEILEVINDITAVTEKSNVSFVVRPKKKKIVQKFLNGFKVIDSKVKKSELKEASASKASASASAFEKAEKERFLKHFYKKEVDPEP